MLGLWISLIALLYLYLVGLPGSMATPWFGVLEPMGLHVTTASICVHPFKGLVADDVRVYEQPDLKHPIATMESVGLLANPIPRLLGHPWSKVQAHLYDGSFSLPMDPHTPSLVHVEEVVLTLTPDAWHIEKASLQADQCNVQLQGTIYRTPAEGPSSIKRPYAKLKSWLATRPAWIDTVRTFWRRIPHDGMATGRATFNVNPHDPHALEVALTGQGQMHTDQTWPLESWSIAMKIEGPVARLEDFRVQQGAHEAHLTGAADLHERTYNARLFSNLPLQSIQPFLPVTWTQWLCRTVCDLGAPQQIEAWLGPSSFTNPLSQYRGWLSIKQTRVRETWIERAFASFNGDATQIHWNGIEAMVGQGTRQGPVTGHVTLDVPNRRLSGQLQSHCNPRAALTLMPRGPARVVSRFQFSTPPSLRASFEIPLLDPSSLNATGTAHAVALTYREVPLDHAATSFSLHERVFTLDPLTFSRGEKTAEGRLRFYLGKRRCEVDAHGTMPPVEITQMVGTGVTRVASMFPIDGTSTSTIHGLIDYNDGSPTTDFTLAIEARKVGWLRFMADHAVLSMHMTGSTVHLDHVAGEAYDGAFSGSGRVGPFFQPTPPDYQLQGELRNMELEGLIKAFRDRTNAPTGRVSGQCALEGKLGRGQGQTAIGTGNIHVRDGRLFQLPVLGPLSYVLAALVPGFGYSVQTAFDAPFTVRDGKIQTEDARLLGDLLSIQAEGHMTLDGQLDFDAQVHLFRSGPLVYVLRMVTFPVSKLFEVRLSGTLKDPHWSTANLPDLTPGD